MNKKQKLEIDSLLRARAYLNEPPVRDVAAFQAARSELDDVLAQVDAQAGEQALSLQLGRAEYRRQDDQIGMIYETFMRPIATIARMQIQPGTDAGLPAGLRLPKFPLPPSKAVAASHGMIEAARPYEALFVSQGLPADFLAQFSAARDALVTMRANSAAQSGRRVLAGTNLEAELRRGRRAVTQIDTLVRATLRGNVAALTAWRLAKRVHEVPSFASRGAAPSSEGITEVAA